MFTYYKRAKYLKNPAIRALLIGDSLVMTASAMLAPIYAAFVTKVGGDIWEAGVTAGHWRLARESPR